MFFKKKKEEPTPPAPPAPPARQPEPTPEPAPTATAPTVKAAPATPTPKAASASPAVEKAAPAPSTKTISVQNGSAALAAAPAAKTNVVTGRIAAPQPTADDVALTPEEQEKHRQAAALSKRISTGLGEITSVLMRSKTHAVLPIAQLQTLLPAIARNQYVTAEARSRENGMSSPIAVVIWATVSDEVDKRLAADAQKPLSLTAADWAGGPNVWVIEAVGEPRAVSALIKRLQDTRWKGQAVKLRARGEDGQASIRTLDAPA